MRMKKRRRSRRNLKKRMRRRKIYPSAAEAGAVDGDRKRKRFVNFSSFLVAVTVRFIIDNLDF